VVMLNGAAVSWQSTRQQVTALSTAETEYYAASVAGTDVTYMSRIMEDLGFAQLEPTVLWEDNMACIYMSQTSVMYHKARHIDTRVYHLRELCKDGALVLKKVSSAEHVADSLTKSTPKPAFEKHRDAMLGAVDERFMACIMSVFRVFLAPSRTGQVENQPAIDHRKLSTPPKYPLVSTLGPPGLLTASGSRLAAESMVVMRSFICSFGRLGGLLRGSGEKPGMGGDGEKSAAGLSRAGEVEGEKEERDSGGRGSSRRNQRVILAARVCILRTPLGVRAMRIRFSSWAVSMARSWSPLTSSSTNTCVHSG